MRLLRLVASILVIAVVLVVSPIAHAAAPNQGINLQISPLPIELNIKPGSGSTTDLRVRNGGTQPEKLKLHILKVSQDDNGQVHLTEPGQVDDWVKWISFSKPVFDAPAGQWQTIKMNINLPKSAAFGYYFAVEYMRAEEAKSQNGAASTQGAVATFILLNADSPGAKRIADVKFFKTNRRVYEFLPVNFAVKIHNSGNVHVAPTGNIFILKNGKQIDSIQINPAASNILPNGSRIFTASWTNGFPAYEVKKDANGQPVFDKHSNPVTYLKWDFSKANRLRWGHYQAHLIMVYNDGQRDVPIDATVSFWIIPWRIIGAVFALIALITGLIIYIVILRRKLKRASGQKEKPKKVKSNDKE